MDNLSVTRSELKYYISKNEYISLINRLKHVLPPDKHSVPGRGYYIRSLYFDSYDDKCLHEKQSGFMYRQKYRLRIYDTNAETVKFEIKNKWNNQIFKESANISRDSAKKIIDGQYEEFLTYNNPILNKAYIEFTQHSYEPRVIVDYDRALRRIDGRLIGFVRWQLVTVAAQQSVADRQSRISVRKIRVLVDGPLVEVQRSMQIA